MQVLQQLHFLNILKISCLSFDINISKFKYSSKNINVYGLDIKNKKVEDTINQIFKEHNFRSFDDNRRRFTPIK